MLKTLKDFVTFAHETNKIFAIEFIRRADGELRKMVCRTNVTKHLKGGQLNYDPAIHNLLPVFDMDNQGYRSIPIENILHISIDGKKYTTTPTGDLQWDSM